MKQLSVLILDDSLLMRELLTAELQRDVNVKIVAKASDAYEARDKIVQLRPDVLITDVNMDKMSGLDFVRKLLPQYFMPVLMMSSDPSQRAIAESIKTVQFFTKPVAGDQLHAGLFFRELNMALKRIATQSVPTFNSASLQQRMIAIGASTGGAEAIETLLTPLPCDMPPIVIALHMPAKFTKTFAQRLNDLSKLSVKEAESGEELIQGQTYVAPGGYHTRIRRKDRKYLIECEENVSGSILCPSIDELFNSVATHAQAHALGVLLTGMGKDGANGLLQMKNAGAYTIGQDERTSVIYGMPKVAHEIGALDIQLPLESIGKKLVDQLHK